LQANFKKYTLKHYKLIDYSKNYGIMYIIRDNIRENDGRKIPGYGLVRTNIG